MRGGCACDADSGDSSLYRSVYNLDEISLTRYGACNILGDLRALDVNYDARNVQSSADGLDNF